MVLLNFHEIIIWLISKRSDTFKEITKTLKLPTYRNFYSNFISELILFFTSIIFVLVSCQDVNMEFPIGIIEPLYSLLIIFPSNITLSIIFILIGILLLIRIFYSFNINKPRINRSKYYLAMMEDPSINKPGNDIFQLLKEYEGYIIREDWENEYNTFMKLKRDVYNSFNNNMDQFIIPSLSEAKVFSNYDNRQKLGGLLANQRYIQIDKNLKEKGFYYLGPKQDEIRLHVINLVEFENYYTNVKNEKTKEILEKDKDSKNGSEKFNHDISNALFSDPAVNDRVSKYISEIYKLGKLLIEIHQEFEIDENKKPENQRIHFLYNNQLKNLNQYYQK